MEIDKGFLSRFFKKNKEAVVKTDWEKEVALKLDFADKESLPARFYNLTDSASASGVYFTIVNNKSPFTLVFIEELSRIGRKPRRAILYSDTTPATEFREVDEEGMPSYWIREQSEEVGSAYFSKFKESALFNGFGSLRWKARLPEAQKVIEAAQEVSYSL